MLNSMSFLGILSRFGITYVVLISMLAKRSECSLESAFLASGDSAEAIKECIIVYMDSVNNDSKLFDFGLYASLTRDNGVRPDALRDLSNLLLPLLVKNPSARFRETEFKSGVASAITFRSDRKIPTEKALPDLCRFIWTQV